MVIKMLTKFGGRMNKHNEASANRNIRKKFKLKNTIIEILKINKMNK